MRGQPRIVRHGVGIGDARILDGVQRALVWQTAAVTVKLVSKDEPTAWE